MTNSCKSNISFHKNAQHNLSCIAIKGMPFFSEFLNLGPSILPNCNHFHRSVGKRPLLSVTLYAESQILNGSIVLTDQPPRTYSEPGKRRKCQSERKKVSQGTWRSIDCPVATHHPCANASTSHPTEHRFFFFFCFSKLRSERLVNGREAIASVGAAAAHDGPNQNKTGYER